MSKIRTIGTDQIKDAVSRLCQEANYHLPDDVLAALQRAQQTEVSPLGRDVLSRIIENAGIASREKIPICQDTGIAVVYLEIGMEVHVTGGDIYDAVNAGVREGYQQGYLRKSVVSRPFSERLNTGDNTSAIIHLDIVPGRNIKIRFMPKGAGSENMARLYMLTPSDGREGIIESVVRAVELAGSNPCPPVIIGVGIGGTAEKAMDLAKRVMFREVGKPSHDEEVAVLETDILKRVNQLGIGPQGFGGCVTALAVHIDTFSTHIGSLPVAVNLQCHALRRKETIL